MRDKFKDNCGAVARPQQVLRMVDRHDTNCLPDRLAGIDNVRQPPLEVETDGRTYTTVQHGLVIWLHGGIVIQDQNLSFERPHR